MTYDAQLNLTTSSLTFTPDNWDIPQTVLVGAVDDNKLRNRIAGYLTTIRKKPDKA